MVSAKKTQALEELTISIPPVAVGTKDIVPAVFHLVVYKQGMTAPMVQLNLPVSLAELAIAALDESTKAEIRKKGIDIENVWAGLRKLGPTNILTLRDGDKVVKLWVD